jgi:hypothetical protein
VSQPPLTITTTVDTREQQRCIRCGKWVESNGSRHHRQRRRDGGHSVANLVLLCGSGTTGCHGQVHSHPVYARATGYIIPTWVKDVSAIPILVAEPFTPLAQWVLLSENGQRSPIEYGTAQELLALNGIRTELS